MHERLAEDSPDFSTYNKKGIHTSVRTTYLKVKPYFKMHNWLSMLQGYVLFCFVFFTAVFLNSSHLILVLISSQTDLNVSDSGFHPSEWPESTNYDIWQRECTVCVCFPLVFCRRTQSFTQVPSLYGTWLMSSPQRTWDKNNSGLPQHNSNSICSRFKFNCCIHHPPPTPAGPQWGDRSMELSVFCCNPTRIAIYLE